MILPPEIVYQVLTYQFYDLMSNDHPSSPEKFHSNLRIFLRSNLTVNKTFYHICRVLLYRYLNFTSARGFNKLLETLRGHPEVLRYIQVADFQELTSIGLGRSGQMNKTIKNLTNETLWEFLWYTRGSLREFLASEHIQGDLDERIIHFLLKPGTVLSVVDFCGGSQDVFTSTFTSAVERLYDNDQPIDYNYQITSLGLNDCTTITSKTLGKLLATLPELQKLDLTHTSIDDRTIISDIPHLKHLTHLSLSMCSQITPRGILEFFSYHPAITDSASTLQWLNVQVHPHSSSWTDVQLMFLLKKLCRYGHNKTLQYLNIGGMPMHITDDFTMERTADYWQCQDTLYFIKLNFPQLKSLSIKNNNITIPRLTQFLSPLQDDDIPSQQLKYLNIVNNVYINKWTIQDPALFSHSASLCAIELSFDPWQQIEASNPRHEITCRILESNALIQDYSSAEPAKWRCYIGSAYGRRHWLYKTDEYLNREDIETRGYLTSYDAEGNKIIDIVKQPDFLKFAQNKIMLGCGIVRQSRVRCNRTYRDVKPPISQFFNRNKTLAVGPTATPPLQNPVRPPGGWRLIDNEHSVDLEGAPSTIAAAGIDPHDPAVSTFNSSRSGLYWDRSIPNLEQHMQQVETDSDYLNDPELQRRRSRLCLFGGYSGNENSTARIRQGSATGLRSDRPDSSDLLERYDDSNCLNTMSKMYRLHLDVVAEYTVFGCIERGMYRYYSLKT
ncbi:LANO_0D09252g1_1 [Lachancea nothofagi CBS 11611]|uniref:LANO_0D09252g1_1 n=1 Tax=Lachancea nothofagi CBS 11611 TaxID=1266666 RepID=A0A1G4JJA1_9SACH|nr:LANO_0D09252g1_1 [Lachancea nothofagi CBS 11611]